MNKRDYPLFLIDRSKSVGYPFDFITCFDRSVGFVARVVFFPTDEPFDVFIRQRHLIENADFTNLAYKLKRGGLILVVEDFLYHFEATQDNKKRVQTLLAKALKKYIHAEVDRTAKNDFGIDNQIKQQIATIERAKQNHDRLAKETSKEHADYLIALAEATLDTLTNYRDNQKLFYSNN